MHYSICAFICKMLKVNYLFTIIMSQLYKKRKEEKKREQQQQQTEQKKDDGLRHVDPIIGFLFLNSVVQAQYLEDGCSDFECRCLPPGQIFLEGSSTAQSGRLNESSSTDSKCSTVRQRGSMEEKKSCSYATPPPCCDGRAIWRPISYSRPSPFDP